MNVKRREGDEKKKRGSNLSSFREGGGLVGEKSRLEKWSLMDRHLNINQGADV